MEHRRGTLFFGHIRTFLPPRICADIAVIIRYNAIALVNFTKALLRMVGLDADVGVAELFVGG